MADVAIGAALDDAAACSAPTFPTRPGIGAALSLCVAAGTGRAHSFGVPALHRPCME
jgi:hypothetical protein